MPPHLPASSCYTRLLVLSHHIVRGTSNKSIEGGVVTDCKRRPSRGLPGRGRPSLPFGPSRRAAASLLTRSAPNSRTPAPPCALSSARLNPGEFGLLSGSNITLHALSNVHPSKMARTHTLPHSSTFLFSTEHFRLPQDVVAAVRVHVHVRFSHRSTLSPPSGARWRPAAPPRSRSASSLSFPLRRHARSSSWSAARLGCGRSRSAHSSRRLPPR